MSDQHILRFDDDDALGYVISVDTATVVVDVIDTGRLRRMQVNRLVECFQREIPSEGAPC